MTSLSCSESCLAQPVQYHCETTMSLTWCQRLLMLGGLVDGYIITVVPKDGEGLSSNISSTAYSNNTTPIHCIDTTNALDTARYCSLLIGEFSLKRLSHAKRVVLMLNVYSSCCSCQQFDILCTKQLLCHTSLNKPTSDWTTVLQRILYKSIWQTMIQLS